jgi:DNA polymerase III subunit epsilon
MLMLSELEVLVVDCQTTSSSPDQGMPIEIGWARVGPGRELAVRAELVALPEGHRLPWPVARLTGIDPRALEGAPASEEIWSALCDDAVALTAPAPTIVHFARFERSFLEPLHARAFPDRPFPLDLICTHEIARRLLPELPRRSLRALAGYFGFDAELSRRSRGHVEATAHLWRHLARELEAQGLRGFHDLAAWLDETRARRKNGRGFPVARERRLDLADAPGVYRFLRQGGRVLYVGKAKSLRRRVNSYFTKRRGSRERLLEMLSQAREIDVTFCATVVEAALLESDEIKRHRPPYNRQLLSDERHAWFVSADLSEARTAPDDRCRIGPLPSRFALASFASLCCAIEAPDDASRAILARAMAETPGWGPSPEELASGLACFRARHGVPLERPARELMQLSKRLAALARAGSLDEGERGAPRQRPWDPDRVARHVERVALAAGQLVRRSRLLCLISESSVSWHEPGEPARRLLVVEGADVVDRAFVAPDRPSPPPRFFSRALRDRQERFDIAAYDRLRILATELKRLSDLSDDVELRLTPDIALRGTPLRRVLEVC